MSSPMRTLKRWGSAPPTEISRGAVPLLAGAAPLSSIRNVRVTGSPMIANAGAFLTNRRRSQSVSLPVSSRCRGAGRSSGKSASCTCPSLMAIRPATRARGSSAKASDRAVIRRVPASSSPSGTEMRRTSVFSRVVSAAVSASAVFWVWSGRSRRR